MPISEARAPALAAVVLAAAVALAGCVEGFGTVSQVAVAGGGVVVAGPPGYCVDRQLTRDSAGEAFVVFGSCAALSPGAAASGATPAVLTATVGAATGQEALDPARLEAFLRSAEGRAALSRSGDAGSVRILGARAAGDTLRLRIRDTSADAASPDVSPDYWRAVFAVRGRLVTATVMAFRDRPLSPDQGAQLLDSFVAELRAANPEPGS